MLVQGTFGWLCKANLHMSIHLAGADLCNSTLVHLWREDWGKAITETISSNHTSPKQWCSPCPWNAWSSSSRGNYCSISYFQKCISSLWHEGNFPNSLPSSTILITELLKAVLTLQKGGQLWAREDAPFPLPCRKHKSDCAVLSINSAYFFSNKL